MFEADRTTKLGEYLGRACRSACEVVKGGVRTVDFGSKVTLVAGEDSGILVIEGCKIRIGVRGDSDTGTVGSNTGQTPSSDSLVKEVIVVPEECFAVSDREIVDKVGVHHLSDVEVGGSATCTRLGDVANESAVVIEGVVGAAQ